MREKHTTYEQLEVKSVSKVLETVQSEVVNSQLGMLEKKILKNTNIDAIDVDTLPTDVEKIKNFEAFEWEVIRLMAFLHTQQVDITHLSDLLTGGVNKATLPPDLQKVAQKTKQIFGKGISSPVYQKLFDDWQTVVTGYIMPHAGTLLQAYGKPSLLSSILPASFTSLNTVSGAVLGGGLYLLWNSLGKLFGLNKEPFSIKSMLGFVLGGTALGSIPAGANMVSSFTNAKQGVKEYINEKNTSSIIADSNNSIDPKEQIFPPNFSMDQVKTIDDLFKNANQAAMQRLLGNIPITVLYGQMALESGGNISQLARKYNNFFGIKYRKGMSEATPVSMATNEEINGNMQRVSDSFAHFKSPEACFKYYIKNMMNPTKIDDSHYAWIQKFAPRIGQMYAVKENGKWIFVKESALSGRKGISMKDNPIVIVECIRGSGYATDSRYAQKVKKVLDARKSMFALQSDDLDAGLAFAKFISSKVPAAKTAYLNNKEPTLLA